MIDKILILGSLPKHREEENLYNSIINIASKFSSSIKSPIDTAKFNGTEIERYNRAFKTVKEADLIISEQTRPSTGQSMEIREAVNLNKSLIVIAKNGSKVSELIKRCPIVIEVIYYENINDLKIKLQSSIKHNIRCN